MITATLAAIASGRTTMGATFRLEPRSGVQPLVVPRVYAPSQCIHEPQNASIHNTYTISDRCFAAHGGISLRAERVVLRVDTV